MKESIEKDRRKEDRRLPEEERLPDEEFNKFVNSVKEDMWEKEAEGAGLNTTVINFIERLREKSVEADKEEDYRGGYYTNELAELFKESGLEVPYGVVDALRSNTEVLLEETDEKRKKRKKRTA